MIQSDLHTHTFFSADGRQDLRVMIERAISLGLRYYGTSEHFDYDYISKKVKIRGEDVRQIDAAAYFDCARAMQNEYSGRISYLIGCEFGYDDSAPIQDMYCKISETYSPDFIVNSVHTCLGKDCYFPEFFAGKSKEYAYSAYLYRVLESLDAPYPYDVVAHIGYCARNAAYADPKLRYADFADIIDAILKKIIEKNKILEVNSSAKTAGSPFIPDTDILQRYFDLGGRKVIFSSDAHDETRIGDKRDIVSDALKKIGFTHVTLPVRGKYIEEEL
ncbi:MAG TPA: histidinol-phosphatase HisJ family protein [Candidatus Borkfalkia avistercoris]|uniref:Histidinol-phosphatase n=1 Tax=Candidatus Borkfalkia avistercoris TaxID=2838504 RepID=A0A9D2A6R9_9FIRM|nr:histidinol-phosphatase HisJ family protein [Candidatus Borkfalkia avistercoris]